MKEIILISCQGNKMYVNPKDGCVGATLAGQGVYERYETKVFKQFIEPGMIIVDIGAHIGYYTLIAADLLGNIGKVYAFEPEPHNYELIVKNIRINNYKNIIPIQKALSNKNKKVKLFLDKLNLGMHSLSEQNISKKNGFTEIKTTTLDDFFENIAKNHKVDLLKVDAQGAEGLIMEGAVKILKNNNLKIFLEFWPRGLKNVGTNPLQLLNTLTSCGFTIKFIDEKKQVAKSMEATKIIEMNKEEVNLLLEK